MSWLISAPIHLAIGFALGLGATPIAKGIKKLIALFRKA